MERVQQLRQREVTSVSQAAEKEPIQVVVPAPLSVATNVYLVLVHKGNGQVGGIFSKLSDALVYVGQQPACGYEIVAHLVVDAAVGTVMDQRP